MDVHPVESKKEDSLGGDTIVEQGTYNMIASTAPEFKITHLVLKAENGSKRVWHLRELSEKEVKFDIEKFS